MPLSGLAASQPGAMHIGAHAQPIAFAQPPQSGAAHPLHARPCASAGACLPASAKFRYTRMEAAPGRKPPVRRGRAIVPHRNDTALAAWPTHPPTSRNAPRTSTVEAPHATTAAPANTWQRAQALFAATYAQVFSLTDAQARARLRNNDALLYDEWRGGVEDFNRVAWVPSPADSVRSPYDIAYAATRFSRYLHTQPDLDQATARAVAQLYLTRPPVEIIEGDVVTAVYQDVLQRRLDWVDIKKIRGRNMHAGQILKAVCHRRRQDVSSKTALGKRLRNVRDVIVDEAALIAFLAARHGNAMPESGSISAIRAQFVTSLIDAWQDTGIGISLIPSAPVPPRHALFWHDGMVLRNGRGKNLQGIVDTLYAKGDAAPESDAMQRLITYASRNRLLLGQPDDPISADSRETLLREMHGDIAASTRYAQRDGAIRVAGAWLTKNALLQIVEKTLRGLALDPAYPGGTPLHAAATILLQQGPMHGIYFTQPGNPTELMRAFDRLNHAWHQHPRTPAEPRMCAAYYLAAGSGVLLTDAASSDDAGTQLSLRIYSRMATMMSEADSGTMPDVATTLRRMEDILALPSRSSRIAALQTLVREGPMEIYLMAQSYIQHRLAAPETISYRGTEDLHRQLADYFNERLLAHAPYPRYDEDFLILQVLQGKLGMRTEDLDKTEFVHFNHLPGRLPLVVRNAPLAEFKRCASAPHGMAAMTFRNLTINAADERAALRKEAERTLRAHPVIVAKSKEIFRTKGKAFTDRQLQETGNLLVRDVAALPPEPLSDALFAILESLFGSPTVKTIVEAFASGKPREILGLLPFIIPLYDIEEGIRLGDKHRAFDGAMHFGEDAILTLLGAGAETLLRRQLARDAEMVLFGQSRMTAGEHAGAQMLQDMQTVMPEAEAGQLARQSIMVDADVFDVHAETAEVTEVAETAEVAEAGQTHPKSVEAAHAPGDRSYRMLFLEGDDHATPARAVEGGNTFIETDLRGNVIPDAPLIVFEADTQRYRQLKRADGLRFADGTIPWARIARRITVSETMDYWRQLMKLPGIRVRSREPADIIRTIFKPGSHPLYEEFIRFWITAYERSETASTIINGVFQKVAKGKQACRLEFEAEHPHEEHSSLWFISDEELAKLRYTSPRGTEPFQRSRMWVHEAMHWMTDTFDPTLSKMTTHRGATVFLTNRILNELGDLPPILPRTTYIVPPELEAGATEANVRNWGRTLRKNNDWAAIEDLYLDAALDAQRVYPSTMRLFGQPVAERATVRQALAYEGVFSSFGKLAPGNTAHIFNQIADAFSAPARLHLRGKLNTLIRGSRMFLKMATAWHTKSRTARVRIEVESFASHYLLYEGMNRHAFHIAENSGKLLLNSEEIHYYSEQGLELLGPMRQFVGAMVDLFLHDLSPNVYHLPLKSGFHERGAGVMFENLVLRQIGDPSPRRICAALTQNPNAYLAIQSAVTRAMVSENGYLKRILETGAQPAPVAAAEPLQTIPEEEGCSNLLCL
ncbi:hypothetical protein D9O50_11845 [Oxalobacteraceae bacterium CAVE-383]|nr:hypothetical protein D9O50_11845 [Oxalobacteraceae bacterium CAVE-383]